MPLTSKVVQALGGMEEWNFEMGDALESLEFNDFEVAAIFADHWQDCCLTLRRELGGDGLEIMRDDWRKDMRRMANSMIRHVDSITIRTLTSEWINTFARSRDMAREILAELDGGTAS